jgi:hypothetical protein
LVVGHAKTDIINKEPLLRLLVVVGYGFGDEHINAVIGDAVNSSDLRLHVVTPKSATEFREEINPLHGTSIPKPRADDILRAFVHTPHRITDFYLSGEARPTSQGIQFLKSVGLV